MDILQAIKEWLYTYEGIKEDGTIYADYLPNEVTNYSINKLGQPQGDVLTRFINGDQIKQYAFSFDIIESYSTTNDSTNRDNIQFLTELQEWIEDNESLPNVTGAQRMETLQSGTMFDLGAESMTAVYRLTVRLIYIKKKERF